MGSFKKTVVAAALALASTSGAWGAVLYATTNSPPGGGAGAPATLLTIDTTTGATTVIGAVGFVVNGLTFDATTGTLYGSAASDVGLITINTTTGAGTLVAGGFGTPSGGCGVLDRNVMLTANSGGSLYGWCDPDSDDLQSINKVTGLATRVGESGVSTGGHSLAFDNSDILYLYQSGTVFTVDTGTGAATGIGTPSGAPTSAHHGDFNPDDNMFYGVSGFGAGGRLDIYDFGANAFVSSLTLDRSDVFAVAFATDVPEPGSLAILGLGLAALGFARRRKA